MATQCIAVDVLEVMSTQSGPYREAETIEEDDIKRITGVLYGGNVLYSIIMFCG